MKNKNSLILVIVIILAIISITTAFLLTNQKEEVPSENNEPSGMIDYITFSCPSGEDIKINYEDDISEATVLFKNEEYNLQRARSASGSRYTNEDESIVFWEHQGEAKLEVNGETIAENCRFKEAEITTEEVENNTNKEKLTVPINKKKLLV